jgi:tetratricopeptide (TPR) repeat protein
MRALSLFSEPVPFQAVNMMATEGGYIGTEQIGNANTPFERELNVLKQLALIRSSVDASGIYHYSLHPLLRQYVIEHYLEGSDRSFDGKQISSIGVSAASNSINNNDPEALQVALAAGHMQVATYYFYVTTELCPPRDRRTGLQDVVPLVETIRHLCFGWHWQDACNLLFEEGLHESMVKWGAWNTLIGLYTALMPPFGVIHRADEALVSSHLGLLYGRVGEYQQSEAYCEHALALQRELGDVRGEANTLTNRGELLRLRGEWDQAYTYFEQALQLNQKGQDPHLHCVILHDLGLLYHDLKNYELAQNSYIIALKLIYSLKPGSETKTYTQDLATILTNLGMLLYEQGRQLEAMALLLISVNIRQSLQDPTLILLQRFLAVLEQKMGPDSYTRLCQQALGIQKQLLASFLSSPV